MQEISPVPLSIQWALRQQDYDFRKAMARAPMFKDAPAPRPAEESVPTKPEALAESVVGAAPTGPQLPGIAPVKSYPGLVRKLRNTASKLYAKAQATAAAND